MKNFEKRFEKSDFLKIKTQKAMTKLSELATKNNLTEVERDGLILRFQFTFELLWKCGKEFLQEEHGFELASPKKIIRAFRETSYFSDEETELLLSAAEDRNLAAHTYDELKAEQISNAIKSYFPIMQKWLSILS